MKKVISVVAALTLMLAAALPWAATPSVAAAATPTISTGDYLVNPGDTIDVPIVISGNPGIVSLAFKIGYDSDVLELVGKTNGDFDGDYSFSTNLKVNPYKINWMNALATEDITTNGTFVTLQFKVKEDAPIGASTTFSYSYNQDDICNFDWEDVIFNFIGGTVTVVSSAFSVGDHHAAPGEAVEVPIVVSNNLGIVSVSFELEYDSDVLELIGKRDGVFGGQYTYEKNTASNPYKISWRTLSSGENVTTSGVLTTLVFKIKEDAPTGAVAAIAFTETEVFDCHLDELSCGFVGGSVIVSERLSCINHRYDNALDATCSRCKAVRAVPQVPETAPYVATGNYTITRGETFDVPIYVGNNPGIVSLAFKIGYDSSVLELVGKQNGDFDGDYSFSPNLTVNPYKLNWMNALTTKNITTNGTFATLTFKVKEDAPIGASTTFTYSYNQVDIYNFNFKDVIYNFIGGTVTVAEHPVCIDHEYSHVFDASCNNCSVVRAVPQEPETAPYVATGNYTVTRGETFDVPIVVGNNPGVISLAFKIGYDSSVLELVGKQNGEFDVNGEGEYSYSKSLDVNPYKMSWCAPLAEEDITTDGTFVTLTFKVKEDAPIGATTTFTYEYDQADICNFDWEDIIFNFIGDTVTVVREREYEHVHAYEHVCSATCLLCGEVRAVPHAYTYVCDKECNACGAIREAEHIYSAVCDTTCDVCGKKRVTEHTYDDGYDLWCNVCGENRTAHPHHYYIGKVNGVCPVCGGICAAPMDGPYVMTDDYKVKPGQTFEVPIYVGNNPGVISLAFKIGYDSSVLELVGKTNGDFDGDYSFSTNLKVNPYKINWMNALATEDITTNGTFMTLTFKVKEDAPIGASFGFTYEYYQADICNFDWEDIIFNFIGGTVTVIRPGDVNNDGIVNNRDAIILNRYLNEWDVDLVVEACDVSGDGRITNRDSITLNRYLDDWDIKLL